MISKQDPRSVPFLLCYDELRAFVSKAQIRSSVLREMLSTFFEEGKFGNATTTKADGTGGLMQIHDASVSLLGASTLDTFETMFDKDFLAIGFLNRLWVVRDRSDKSFSLPPAIPADELASLRQRVSENLRSLYRDYERDGHRTLVFPVTEEARAIFKHWYDNRGDSVLSTRLDTYGHRLSLILAATSGKREVDAEVMRGVVALLRWQLSVRLECDPIDADTQMARVEESIRRKLERGPLSDAELKKKCNGKRFGTYVWTNALKNLSSGGEIERVQVGTRPGWRLVV